MTYGKGAASGVTGVALLPFTGSNSALIYVAAGFIALGVATLLVSVVLARKNSASDVN
jgi:hypothetical protein